MRRDQGGFYEGDDGSETITALHIRWTTLTRTTAADPCRRGPREGQGCIVTTRVGSSRKKTQLMESPRKCSNDIGTMQNVVAIGQYQDASATSHLYRGTYDDYPWPTLPRVDDTNLIWTDKLHLLVGLIMIGPVRLGKQSMNQTGRALAGVGASSMRRTRRHAWLRHSKPIGPSNPARWRCGELGHH